MQAPPEQIKASAELLNTPFYPQEQYQCGPAALATMAAAADIDVTPDELVSQVYIPERHGSLQIEMLATARSLGLLTQKLNPELLDLLKEIDAGNPVLVFQNLSYDFYPLWHYAVVVGYDLPKQQLVLRSGTIKRHLISFKTFERTWQRVHHWAYVLLPAGQIARTVSAQNYLLGSLDFEQTQGSRAALPALEQGVKHWSGNSQLRLALANSQYALGEFQPALKTLLMELQNDPLHANAWNNIAYIYAALDCPIAAQRAVECASQLDPGDANIAHSLIELGHPQLKAKENCTPARCPMQPVSAEAAQQ